MPRQIVMARCRKRRESQSEGKMKRAEIDMLGGSLTKNIFRFTIQVILTGVLQLLFNACDMAVVGQFAGSSALAAVGATTYLTNLLVNTFLGLSIGVNVIAAQYVGAKNQEQLKKTVNTAITVSLLSGILLAVIGICVSRICLIYMNTPDNIIDQSLLYIRIYCLGSPAIMVYNFGAAILRAQGNTKQPLFYLACTGVINVILNMILVIGFLLDVAGVAIATLVSQVVSAILVIRYLVRQKGAFHLDIRKLRIDKTILGRILRVGIPAGLNNTVFSISNMQIQSSINLFGSAAIAGCSAATSIEGFVYAATNSMHQAGINFTGQNVGAGRRDRVPKILRLCLLYAGLFGLVLGFAVYGLGRPLLSLYTHETADIEYGMIRMAVLMLPYFLCGIMEAVAGVLRGLGYSVMPTVVTLVGACGFRIIWIQTIFKTWTSLEVLFLSFPISWVLTTIAHFIFYLVVAKKDRNML